MQLPLAFVSLLGHYNKGIVSTVGFQSAPGGGPLPKWKSRTKVLWVVYTSICCNGVWPCFTSRETLVHLGSQLSFKFTFFSLQFVDPWKQELLVIPFSFLRVRGHTVIAPVPFLLVLTQWSQCSRFDFTFQTSFPSVFEWSRQQSCFIISMLAFLRRITDESA